jgi:WD40 repeat protein
MDDDADIIDLILRGKTENDLPEMFNEYAQESPSTNVEGKNNDNAGNSTTISAEKEESTEKVSEEKETKKVNEVKKKKKKEERKEIDETFPQFKNPLDFVKYVEIDRVPGTILNEMQNFVLKNHRKKNNKYDVMDISSLSQLQREIEQIDINLTFSKNGVIFLYTKNANILLFSLKEQKFIKKISTKINKNSTLNCLDVTDDLQEIICGSNDGLLSVISIQTGETKLVFNKVHKDCSCVELKILRKDHKLNEIYFISSGGDGQVFYHILNLGTTGVFRRLNSTPLI